MIHLVNICKSYLDPAGLPLPVLNNINLTVQSGEICGVIGKSGAGKSTLLRCVNLLERPNQGSVTVAGQALTQLSAAALRAARRQIGMIFQHFNLLETRTVYQNIALPLVLAGFNKAQIADRVKPLLALTHLEEKQQAYPAALSGGQKQRVAIARALASNPKVLLCDEATSALDPHTTRAILALLKDINKKLNLSILLITHEINVIKEICDTVALIHQGELIEHRAVYDFFTQPKTALAHAFIKDNLKYELPRSLAAKLLPTATLTSSAVLRIIFYGHAAQEPLIAHLMQTLQIQLNILQANLEFLQDKALGIMIVEARATPLALLQQGMTYLEQHNVNVEILGYVEPHTV